METENETNTMETENETETQWRQNMRQRHNGDRK